MVRPRGLEPLLLAEPDPKSGASANFATGASRAGRKMPAPPAKLKPAFTGSLGGVAETSWCHAGDKF
jgi:hypothetical protein